MSRASRTTTAIRFPRDIHDQLKAAADDRDLSMNFLVVRAVREFLDRLLPADEIEWTRRRDRMDAPMRLPDGIHADLMPSVDGGKPVEVILRREVTHRCPPEGEGLMPCCGRTPFEVSRWDRITLDADLVTCGAFRESPE